MLNLIAKGNVGDNDLRNEKIKQTIQATKAFRNVLVSGS